MMARRVIAGRNQRLWTPSEITTALWLDAADSSTITKDGSNLVSQWNDKSGNARHASQASGTLQATYSATQTNGKPALVFTNHEYSLPAGIYHASPAICLVYSRSSATTSVLVRLQNNNEILVVDYYSGFFFWITQRGYNQKYFLYTPSSYADIFFGDSGTSSGTEWTYYFNDAIKNKTSLGQSGGSGNNNILGRNENGTNPFIGALNEIIVLPGSVPTATRQKLAGYLAHKWGLTANLPTDHPYKSRPPRV